MVDDGVGDGRELRAELAAIPVIAHLGIRFGELRGGSAVAVLPPTDHVQSHIGSVSAGPLFALGEAAAAASVWGLFGDRLADAVPLAHTAEIRFLAIAEGPLTATAHLRHPAQLRADFQRHGVARFGAAVQVRNWDDVPVCEMTVQFVVRSGSSGLAGSAP